MMRIQKNCMVTFSYRLLPTSEPAPPAPEGPFKMQILVGHDRLPPTLEQELLGLSAGDRIDLELPADAWFGFPSEATVTRLPLSAVVAPGAPQVGQVHHIMDENSSLKPFRLVAIEGDRVLADFNPDSPGSSLRLGITIESVRWASIDELKRVLQPVAPGR